MDKLFSQNVIAFIWDFDKTLSPHYMQKPLFEHFKVDEKEFWQASSELYDKLTQQNLMVNKESIYLNLTLEYIKKGTFKNLSNSLLKQLGANISFYDGVFKLFGDLKQLSNSKTYKDLEIKIEHYIVSAGFRQMVLGSKISQFIEGVWGCEFSEDQHGIINNSVYVIDNTTKTRSIFEINKGSNKTDAFGVNDKMAQEQRRVPFDNMIYIGDGPSDIPAFSLIRKNGGHTFAVYGDEKNFKQVKDLQDEGRIKAFGPANYTPQGHSYLWLINTLKEILNRIKQQREHFIKEHIKSAPSHN